MGSIVTDGARFQSVLRTWPSSPYKGISYYLPEDQLLFAGRSEDVRNNARILANDDTRLLVLHGGTGCGKSSFLRAGLIPYLERRGFGFEFIKERDDTGGGAGDQVRALFIRSTDRPVSMIAQAVYGFVSKPIELQRPGGESWSLDLRDDLGTAANAAQFSAAAEEDPRILLKILRALQRRYPYTLVLVIDQAEEVLTLDQTARGDKARARYFELLAALTRSAGAQKVVIALRTEYFGRFSSALNRYPVESAAIRDRLLDDLSREGLIEAIERPTRNDLPQSFLGKLPQPRAVYRFRFEARLVEKIADDLLKVDVAGGMLPAMQIVCERLYKFTKANAEEGAEWTISSHAYGLLGEIEDQIESYIEETIMAFVDRNAQHSKLGAGERSLEIERWKWLLTKLAVTQYDGTAVTTLMREERLRRLHEKYECKIDFDAMLRYLSDEDQRIVRRPVKAMDKETKQMANFYSLGHDALALALVAFKNSQEELRRKGGALESFVTTVLRAVLIFLLAFPLATGALMVFFIVDDRRLTGEMQVALFGSLAASLALGSGLWNSSRIAARLVRRRPWLRD